MSIDRLVWRWWAFGDLHLAELQNILRARQQVFVVEQACAFLDVDGADEHCWHLAAWVPHEVLPHAYARLVAPGVKYAEPSIGRVLTTAAARGTGLGRVLMARALAECGRLWPGAALRIPAQSYLEAFYADFGFAVIGDRYLEDGIPHTEMLRAAYN